MVRRAIGRGEGILDFLGVADLGREELIVGTWMFCRMVSMHGKKPNVKLTGA